MIGYSSGQVILVMFRNILKICSTRRCFVAKNHFDKSRKLWCRKNYDVSNFEKLNKVVLSSRRLNDLFSRLTPQSKRNSGLWGTIMISGFFGLFKEKEEEKSESELIMTIKRAVLLIQRDDFKGAEQLLHLALKLAQDQHNEDGVTYIYDLLANLAFAQGHFNTAEKLFVNVMQRLIQVGVSEDDLKINHISLKLAKIYEEKKDDKKAEEGYKFCLKNLQGKVDVSLEDHDAVLLWAMSLDWYARFLLSKDRLDDALANFEKAYELSLKLHGEIHEQTVVLLNDLGTICYLKGDHDNALNYLTKAIEIGKHLPNMEDFSSVYVNLGNIYMQQKMFDEAKKYCKEGWQNANRHKNNEGIQEATLCLKELSKIMSS
ncbi:tetratricopeptide repeat protein 19 homolog, mitochondrial [Halyomorpha halys]|uniref:tetratricopeptide repeat protein 19 homolog, mitochondrial n=1 Tax=Halyomorpha halys TaxID=286706 RepID=UPI0006D4F231|nr:tetratricopeptide repeat protein 19 homolog, mitochondrial [Halyomorpha halys]